MLDLDVRYGDAASVDWRKTKYDDGPDDDEELSETPCSVIDMLGFDPLDAEIAQAQDSDGAARGGTLDVHGLRCVIETPKGGVRSGRGWSVTMPADYGYIHGVQGADGDSLDCYVGPDLESRWVYVIDQRHLPPAKTGFDEHKVMLGFSTKNEALAAYRAGHHRYREVILDWTPFLIQDFKEWTKTGDLTKPCSSEVKL